MGSFESYILWRVHFFPLPGIVMMGSTYKRDRLEMNQVIRFSRIQQFSNHQTEGLLPRETARFP